MVTDLPDPGEEQMRAQNESSVGLILTYFAPCFLRMNPVGASHRYLSGTGGWGAWSLRLLGRSEL